MTAGVVLGVQSVPDGLATGLLAGLNPSAGLYGYMIGTATGAVVTSSTFMAVQGTGAMAMVIADVPGLSGSQRPSGVGDAVTADRRSHAHRGVAATRLGAAFRVQRRDGGIHQRGGRQHRARPARQPDRLQRRRRQRVVRAVNTLVRPDRMNAPTLAVGLATIAIIVLLGRTRLGAMGLVIAVIATSAVVYIGGWDQVATLSDLGIAVSTRSRHSNSRSCGRCRY